MPLRHPFEKPFPIFHSKEFEKGPGSPGQNCRQEKLQKCLNFQESSKTKFESSITLPKWREAVLSLEKAGVGMAFSLLPVSSLSAGSLLFAKLLCITMLG